MPTFNVEPSASSRTNLDEKLTTKTNVTFTVYPKISSSYLFTLIYKENNSAAPSPFFNIQSPREKPVEHPHVGMEGDGAGSSWRAGSDSDEFSQLHGATISSQPHSALTQSI